MGYSSMGVAAAEAPAAERADFIRKTYLHLGGAVLLFALLETLLVRSSIAESLVYSMVGSRLSWFLVLAAFIGVGSLAESFAKSPHSQAMQYVGLGLYVVAEVVVFLPMIYIARALAGPEVIATAAILTGIIFAGLTLSVFLTRSDFSWLRQALFLASLGALGLIAASMLFGFSLGILFSAAMVVLAGLYILYYTSNVLHYYPVGAHVAAALALFSAVALLFWYLLRILSSRR